MREPPVESSIIELVNEFYVFNSGIPEEFLYEKVRRGEFLIKAMRKTYYEGISNEINVIRLAERIWEESVTPQEVWEGLELVKRILKYKKRRGGRRGLF